MGIYPWSVVVRDASFDLYYWREKFPWSYSRRPEILKPRRVGTERHPSAIVVIVRRHKVEKVASCRLPKDETTKREETKEVDSFELPSFQRSGVLWGRGNGSESKQGVRGAVGGNPRANQRHMFLRIDWDRDRMAELFRAFWGYVHAEEGGLRTFFGEVPGKPGSISRRIDTWMGGV